MKKAELQALLEKYNKNLDSLKTLFKSDDGKIDQEEQSVLDKIGQLINKIQGQLSGASSSESSSSSEESSASSSENASSEENSSPKEEAAATGPIQKDIKGSVGKGGKNETEDVRAVQAMLKAQGVKIEVTGEADNSLTNAIKLFQRRLGTKKPDGRVDPGGKTLKGLRGEIPVGPPSTAVSAIIQGGESGAAGYNAYNRGTQGNKILGPVGPRELVKMTIAEIKADQARKGDDQQRLFAVGKYQMIPTTLAEGVKKLNIADSTKFSADIQELLFSDYLMGKKRPAIRAYIMGQGDAFSAQMDGAKEWASIARPDTGRSYYDKQGGNSAHITAEDFLSALNEAKASYEANIAKGMSPDDAYRQAVSGVEKQANSEGGDDKANSEDSSSSSEDSSSTTTEETSSNDKETTTEEGNSSSGDYTIVAGDTGYKIAAKLGISFDELSAANAAVVWTKLQVGQKLQVPGSKAAETAAPKEETPQMGSYTVVSGDTGYKIAGKLGISFDALSEVNAGVKWSKLQVGQKLNTPAGAGTAADAGTKETTENTTVAEEYRGANKTWDKHTNNRIPTLDARVQKAAYGFINTVEQELGIKLRVTSALRTVAEQDALYKKGNVTKAQGGQSYHNYGLAIDVVEIKNGQPIWNCDWPKIAAVGKRFGFEWGGDWKGFVDKPHFQMPFGKSVRQLCIAKYPDRAKRFGYI